MFSDLLGRLKQRNVLRVGGVYAVTGYALFQVANNLFPALNLPRWTVSLAAALFLLGFPIALVIAYAFERTPEGIRRVGAGEDAPPARLGWFDWALLGATVLLIGLGIAEFASRHARAPATIAAATVAPPAGVPEKSVAVLPFVNFSKAQESDDFADGLTEELINGLAQLPDLHVAGRTSAFYFKGRNEDLREIGHRLGVAHVLEGSVRRSGDRLRITAQLIKVADGFHLWSQTYDRTVNDAFLIQTQISDAVAQVLKSRLLAEPARAAAPDRDPQAHRLELTATSHLRKQELADLQEARAQFERLMALEPDNARAYVGFAEASISLAQNHLALDFDQARRQSQQALDRALQLRPGLADAWRVKGLLERILAIRSGPEHAAGALAAFRHAVELDPNDADSLAMLAAQYVSEGQPAQAAPLLERALEIDPLSRLSQHLLGMTLASQGRFGEARRQYETLIQLYPDYSSARISLGQLLMQRGQLDEAVATLDDPGLIRVDPLAGILAANCYANLSMTPEMTRTLEGIRTPATAAAVAQITLLIRQKRLDDVRGFARRQYAATRDPIWTAAEFMVTAVTGDRAAAQGLSRELPPDLLADSPRIDRDQPIDALLAAEVLRLAGRTEQAERVATAVVRSFDAAPGEYRDTDTLRVRALAFATLGETDRAVDELEHARAQGFRMLVDDEYFLRLEDYPMMANVVKSPRFQAFVRAVEADNAKMRARLAGRTAREG